MPTAGRGILVTGTDTGVGKTYVAVLLARRLRAEGLRVLPFKPVESGCAPGAGGAPHPADAAALRDAAAPGEPLSSVCLYALSEPLSPHLAAAREGVGVDPARIRREIRRGLDRAQVVLVEGAGGIAVEIAKGYSFADLARDAGLAALVVAENRLGVLNHLRLTLSFIERSGVALAGAILNDRARDDFPARESNEAEARRICGRAFLGRIPHGCAALPEAVFSRIRDFAVPRKGSPYL